MNSLLGDKPIKFEISIEQKSALILGAVIFVAGLALYFTIRSLKA